MADLVNNETLEGALFEALGCTEPLTLKFIQVVLSDVTLFDRKQHDYGSANIAEFGLEGVLVRANDKLARLKNLRHKPAAKNEAVADSWADLSVYGVIARLCLAGEWPGIGPPPPPSPEPPKPVEAPNHTAGTAQNPFWRVFG